MDQNKKRILVDIGHPAHVHLFRNAIKIWEENGHSVVITIRDKDITKKLLDLYGFSYSIASRARKGKIGLTYELFEHDLNVLKAAIKNKSKILIGTSVAITHAAKFLDAKSIVFTEDDASVASTFVKLTYPFADAIVTPSCLNEDHGKKHFVYNGTQKLAYLHPNYFKPNPEVLSNLGLTKDDPFFILRFVSLSAAHDDGEVGLSAPAKLELVKKLSKHGRVFISSETPLPDELVNFELKLSPIYIHDALYYAKLFVGDSQSMAVESAILGTPAIRFNTFVGRLSVLQEFDHIYQLTIGFVPGQENAMFNYIEELLSQKDLEQVWQIRRERMLSEKIDVTKWMVEFIENFDSH